MSFMEATETLIARKLKVIRNDKKLKQILGNFHFIATLQDRMPKDRPLRSCGLHAPYFVIVYLDFRILAGDGKVKLIIFFLQTSDSPIRIFYMTQTVKVNRINIQPLPNTGYNTAAPRATAKAHAANEQLPSLGKLLHRFHENCLHTMPMTSILKASNPITTSETQIRADRLSRDSDSSNTAPQ
ncbi:hypothetical protein J6590_084082 [Homalodisca vitripennis]|nr:hypothetical protein J6590_084082 [Homalodisca vitripennis]